MPSFHETFWQFERFAVVGHSARKNFPLLTYGGLKDRGKTVYPVDPSSETVEGDTAYPDLASLPGAVDAVVVEVPRDETEQWVRRAAEAGIKDVWLHQLSDTPEAVALAEKEGIRLRTGNCAVMYLRNGYHTIHRLIWRLRGRY
jgi:predicted CoA-binding protein